MKLIVTFAISCIAIVVMAAGINGLNSETVSAQNIETLSLKDMQVMYGGGDMEECSVTGSGSCFAKPGMTCNDTWVQRNCVFNGIPSFYCEEYSTEDCTDTACYTISIGTCRNL